MFQEFFGLKAAPFQLSPDPDFYFGSQGHRQALSYLKYGVHQRDGFVVITGEIGTGKTTLVRALLSRLDTRQVKAVQIANTQLDEEQLLTAICQGFGVPIPDGRKSQLIGALEAYFLALAVSGRRALLVIDEAQNLGQRQVEELRMLSNFQLGNQTLLQSYLVGQPALRDLLLEPVMEQFRQRVIASCHLGPLTEPETASYIEHRLHHAGFGGGALFDQQAKLAIFRNTEGIPRRINLLCNRLLMAAYLVSRHEIDADFVEDVASAMRLELGAERASPS